MTAESDSGERNGGTLAPRLRSAGADTPAQLRQRIARYWHDRYCGSDRTCGPRCEGAIGTTDLDTIMKAVADGGR